MRLRNAEISPFNLYWTGLTYDPVLFEGVSWRVQLAFYEVQPVWYSELLKGQAQEAQARRQELLSLLEQRRTLLEDAGQKAKKLRRTLESNQG